MLQEARNENDIKLVSETREMIIDEMKNNGTCKVMRPSWLRNGYKRAEMVKITPPMMYMGYISWRAKCFKYLGVSFSSHMPFGNILKKKYINVKFPEPHMYKDSFTLTFQQFNNLMIKAASDIGITVGYHIDYNGSMIPLIPDEEMERAFARFRVNLSHSSYGE